MSVAELISQGVELMFLGMGTVFVFLALLVFVVSRMSRFAGWVESRLPKPATPVATPAASAIGSGEHIAAITAAVHLYRARRS